MIKVLFPPGCYGTYFSRCLYNYSNLRVQPFREFSVDHNGSSHQHRANFVARSLIQEGHVETLSRVDSDKIVTILPCQDHNLDYYNNQFFKKQNGQIIAYILDQMSELVAKSKLNDYWGYVGNFDNSVPRWIMREWCSFWIDDVLRESYNVSKYSSINSVAQLTTVDIFENFLGTLTRVANSLGLTINVDTDIITRQHTNFLTAQKSHNSQLRCNEYIQNLIADKNIKMSIRGIFEEAYIQHLLRKQNLEIRCDGLNIFPTTTRELKSLVYENSNHSN